MAELSLDVLQMSCRCLNACSGCMECKPPIAPEGNHVISSRIQLHTCTCIHSCHKCELNEWPFTIIVAFVHPALLRACLLSTGMHKWQTALQQGGAALCK